MLDWSRAAWRKLHVGDHPEWIALSWQSRCVLLHLFRTVDSNGRMDMGRAGPKAVAALLRIPCEVFEPAFLELKETGWLEVTGTWLLLPWFEESQTTPTAGVIRTKQWRERCDAASHNVTNGDAVRRGVTNVTKEERRGEKKREEEKREEPEVAGNKSPRVCPAVEHLNETARASKGRLGEIERVTPGQSIHFNAHLKAIYAKDDWALLGEWLAAGGEEYRSTLSAGVVLKNATDWIEQAKAWEKAGSPELRKEVGGRRQLSQAEKEEEDNRYKNAPKLLSFEEIEERNRQSRAEVDRAMNEYFRTHPNGAPSNGHATPNL